MVEQVEGGRALLKGRLFGFPVHLDLSFVIIIGILGYAPGVGLDFMLVWLVVATIAVLLHELGHAVAARAIGARPSIALAGFGGVTTFVPPRPMSRLVSIGISLAGPVVGLALGAALIYTPWELLSTAVGSGGLVDDGLRVAIFVTLGWSLLNLLPVLPLDGGQAMRELLPGDPESRERSAAMVSVVAGLLAAGAAWYLLGYAFLAVMMLFLVVSNVLTLRQGATRPDQDGSASIEQQVIEELWQGRPERAREVLAARESDVRVDPVLHGAVLALTGDPQQGRALIAQERTRRPDDVTVAAVEALTLALAHDWDALLARIAAPQVAPVPGTVLERAAAEARAAGRDDVAVAITPR